MYKDKATGDIFYDIADVVYVDIVDVDEDYREITVSAVVIGKELTRHGTLYDALCWWAYVNSSGENCRKYRVFRVYSNIMHEQTNSEAKVESRLTPEFGDKYKHKSMGDVGIVTKVHPQTYQLSFKDGYTITLTDKELERYEKI